MCHMESHFRVLRDSISFGAICAWFAPNAPKSKKLFLKRLFVLQGEEAQVEARFGLFRDSVNLDAR